MFICEKEKIHTETAPHVTGKFEDLSTSEWSFIAFSTRYQNAAARIAEDWENEPGTSFSLRNSLINSKSWGLDLPADLGDTFFKAIEVLNVSVSRKFL